MIKILLVSNDNVLQNFCYQLREKHVSLTCFSSCSEEIKDAASHYSIVLLDFELVKSGRNDLLIQLQTVCGNVVILPLVNEESIVSAIRIFKYKYENLVALPCCIDYLYAQICKVTNENKKSTEISSSDASKLSSLIGTSEVMLDFKQKLINVSKNTLSVLILGETGTGKSFIARLIHQLSPRHNEIFVEENIAAIQESLIEGELFGTKIGAYTGAVSRIGLFEHANNGTLFLDEIACIKKTTQAKLLQVLETGEYRPVGSVEKKSASVRLICATNQQLENLKNGKSFRTDLYFRISGVQLHIPPLRKRKEDIQLLAKYFLDRISQKEGVKKELSLSAIAKLESHYWPGNVRELERCIECAYCMTSREVITDSDIVFIS